MKSLKTKGGTVLMALVVTNSIAVFALVHTWEEKRLNDMLWDGEIYGMAGDAGHFHASSDFRNGKRRLYEIQMVPEDRINEHPYGVFTGKTSGPFKIWTYPCYSILGYPHRHATEIFIKFYNQEMNKLAKIPPASTTSLK